MKQKIRKVIRILKVSSRIGHGCVLEFIGRVNQVTWNTCCPSAKSWSTREGGMLNFFLLSEGLIIFDGKTILQKSALLI